MPSSSIDSCAALNEIDPDSAEDTQFDTEIEADLQEVESVPPESGVDSEVDEFTENAFDALLDEEELAARAVEDPDGEDPDTKVDATRSLLPLDSPPPGATERPVSSVPVSQRAISQQPVSQPPLSQQPVSQQPVSQRPVSRPVSQLPVPTRAVSAPPMSSRGPSSRPVRSRSSELAVPRLSESEALAALDPRSLAERDDAILELQELLAASQAELEQHKAELQQQRDMAARQQELLEQQRAEMEKLSHQRSELEQRRAELERNLAAAREARQSSGPVVAPSGPTPQEFLALRESLNKKDKENLELRGQVSAKSKFHGVPALPLLAVQ